MKGCRKSDEGVFGDSFLSRFWNAGAFGFKAVGALGVWEILGRVALEDVKAATLGSLSPAP